MKWYMKYKLDRHNEENSSQNLIVRHFGLVSATDPTLMQVMWRHTVWTAIMLSRLNVPLRTCTHFLSTQPSRDPSFVRSAPVLTVTGAVVIATDPAVSLATEVPRLHRVVTSNHDVIVLHRLEPRTTGQWQLWTSNHCACKHTTHAQVYS